MASDDFPLMEEITSLAEQLLGRDDSRQADFVGRLGDTLSRARGKDFLVIHNPGGWGNTQLELCLDWERSIVTGVTQTMDSLGHSWELMQYFRSGNSFWYHMRDVGREAMFFFRGKSFRAKVLAAELRFVTQHLRDVKVILVGVSQGAAFSNAVMRLLGDWPKVYSIELGIFFPHMSRRVITERTLAIDSNGFMPDPMANRNLKAGTRAYATAFFRWVQSQLRGKPVKFTHCIAVPGHEYRWEYPAVHQRIQDFLKINFGHRRDQAGGGVS